MERRKWFKRLAAAAAGVGGLVLLAGFGPHGRGGHGHGAAMLTHHLDDLLDDVEATPEQRQRITAVKERLVEQGRALREARHETMKELLAHWQSPSPDLAAIHGRIDARAEEMKRFAHAVADGMGEVHGVLTPEQRQKLAARWQRRIERHEQRGR
jgi:Spy/CpxP family protein refolding chaperone